MREIWIFFRVMIIIARYKNDLVTEEIKTIDYIV